MASLQAAEGKPLHIALLPSEMMAEFRAYNPDMEDALDEALNRDEAKLGVHVCRYASYASAITCSATN